MTANDYANDATGALLNCYDPSLGGSSLMFSTSTGYHNPTFAESVPQFSPNLTTNAAGSYTLPTVVNGMVYVPTSGISYSVPGNLLSAPSGTPSCQPSSPCGGILVFCTTHNSACNASNWQQ